MLKNAESALEMCRQVHRSTEEQKESGRFITASISSVTEMIRSIQRNTESHGSASEAVAEAVTRILESPARAASDSEVVRLSNRFAPRPEVWPEPRAPRARARPPQRAAPSPSIATLIPA
jgi:hypothetical protein